MGRIRPSLVMVVSLASAAMLWPAQADAAVPRCLGRTATIVGTGDGVLTGTASADVIVGSGSNQIDALGGADLVCSPGGDGIDAGPGRDRVDVTGPDDWDTFVDGGPGADVLTIGAFAGGVLGGEGNDVVRAHGTVLFTAGGPGDDVMYDTAGFGVTTGDDGDDLMTGSGAALRGGPGRDVLTGARGRGGVLMYDDPGPDVYLGLGNPRNLLDYYWARGPITADLRAGTVRGAGEPGTTDQLVDVRSVAGTEYPDVLGGDDHDNRLYGIGSDIDLAFPERAGADVVRAGGGDDYVQAAGAGSTVFAGAGADTVTTTGADEDGPGATVYGGPGDDRVTVDGRGYGGPGDDVLVGDFWDDVLVGQSGHDSADGGPDGYDVCSAEVVVSCDGAPAS